MTPLELLMGLAVGLWARWRRLRLWPTRAAVPRACPRCREIAYTPGQERCNKCGAALFPDKP